MSKQQNEPNTEHMNQNQISAIRDILFGQNMKVYDEEFNQLRHVISQHRKETDTNLHQAIDELTRALADAEKRIFEQMQKNHEEVLAAISKLEDDKLDRRKLGKLLSDIGTHISM
ncbi:MAG: hypothetical protein IPM47_10280 [Sphingobacteriales bacterium]|nr:MAG: hypothetical protein IPM47_10280 [Sphingobacteriales bacterium]